MQTRYQQTKYCKKWSKKIKINAKLLKKILKPIKFHLLKNNNLAAKIKHEKIKQIFKKESIFDALFLELCIVLQVLQESNYFI